jgi:endonuclease-3
MTVKRKAGKPAWDEIFATLESWYARQNNDSSGAEAESSPSDPSVTAIARQYHEAETSKDSRTAPWAALVSTILSLRTKDEVTLAASKRLLEKAPGPAALLALGEVETARLAYPAGFYRTKAANLCRIAGILLAQYDGQVPADMDALLALPGVGRKTANLVLVEAFGIDAICVDIHVHRISNRLGWFGPQGTAVPDKTEAALRDILPKKYWQRINALLGRYGQQVCRPVSPLCSRCVIDGCCARMGVGKSR